MKALLHFKPLYRVGKTTYFPLKALFSLERNADYILWLAHKEGDLLSIPTARCADIGDATITNYFAFNDKLKG
jgi:hypothetical protein